MSSETEYSRCHAASSDSGKTAITASEISKCYRIGAKEAIHDTFGASILNFMKSPLNNYRRYRALYRFDDIDEAEVDTGDVIWALKKVSFEVKEGQVMGIIGRNGAGKSTLLKVLSKITEPTKGYAEIRGRVSSLLEVGTGFHGDLSGRENVYLNGTILGMKKREIDLKLNEIIAFSGVERFVDTPVKRYSSGMRLRLAFAVAAHLEPEILIIDEVLAVGDADFQKKCIGKMYEISSKGRTVLFVSHNMGAIIELCPNSILLKNGMVMDRGPSKKVVEQYLSSLFSPVDNTSLENVSTRGGDGRLRFTAVYLRNERGETTNLPISGQPLDIVLQFDSAQNLEHVRFMFTLFNQMGIAVTHCNVMCSGKTYSVVRGGGEIVCRIHELPLPLGTYKIAVVAEDDLGELDWVPTACIFDVDSSSFFTAKFLPPMRYSTAFVEHTWTMDRREKD